MGQIKIMPTKSQESDSGDISPQNTIISKCKDELLVNTVERITVQLVTFRESLTQELTYELHLER